MPLQRLAIRQFSKTGNSLFIDRMQNTLAEGLKKYFTPAQLAILQAAKAGIAGAGGLGSNAALMLARSGIRQLVIIDHDVVEASNLNRQAYWPAQVGMLKTEALAQLLKTLNPEIEVKTHCARLDANNLSALLELAPIWIEALDNAQTKALFVAEAVKKARFVASASGICGYGGPPLGKRQLDNLHIAGDFCQGTETHPPLAPRVIQAAAIMADSVLEYILSAKPEERGYLAASS